MSTPIVFTFQPHPVRVVLLEEEPWFVASDIATALDYSEAAKLTRMLEADEKGLHIVETLGGNQEVSIISQPGLFRALSNSRSPKAKPFQRWLFHDVLPTIYKTGRYVAPQPLTAEELMSPTQQAEIRRLVWLLGNAYHIKNAGEWAAFALVRESFGVANTYQLPARHFSEALVLLEWAQRMSSEFKHRVIEVERKFLKSRFRVCPPELERLADETPGLLLRP